MPSRERDEARTGARPSVEPMQPLGTLQPLAQPNRAELGFDERARTWPRGQPERVPERLEAVGELDLVALAPTEELDPLQALVARRLDRVERVDEPGRAARVGGIEREPMDVHRPLEREVV